MSISYAVFCLKKKNPDVDRVQHAVQITNQLADHLVLVGQRGGQRRGVGQHVLFFFNDTATTEIYTLSLHDALPIGDAVGPGGIMRALRSIPVLLAIARDVEAVAPDRKSTRLNSSHMSISYAVF